MFEQLLIWDLHVFQWINGIDHSVLNGLMPYFRHKLFWVPLYIFLVVFLVMNFPRRGLWILLFAILSVGCSDTVSSKWIKNSVKRIRPCNDPDVMILTNARIRCGGGYSFTSSHAANHSTLAFFFFFLFSGMAPRWRWLAVGWASSIGLAQIYVGVHYPLDVVGGFLVGFLIGWLFAHLYHRFYTVS